MATAVQVPVPKCLTYDEYMAEGEIMQRYDIVDGVRIPMTAPTWSHQEVLLNIAELLRAYQRGAGKGRVAVAPLDILIRRAPRLQVRQPDVLFISNETLASGGEIPEKGLLEAAPELVVEIVSARDRETILDDKLADYTLIGVREAWLIHRNTRTVDVIHLTLGGRTILGTYDETQAVQSSAFPDLTVAVDDIFRS